MPCHDVGMRRELIEKLVGQTVWHVSAGGVSWPSLELALGERVRRAKPLASMRQPEEYRTYRGSFELMIVCAWRLQRGAEVRLGSRGDEYGIEHLDALVGARVVGVICDGFDSGDELIVFADRSSFMENWTLSTPDGSLEVGPGDGWEEGPPAAD